MYSLCSTTSACSPRQPVTTAEGLEVGAAWKVGSSVLAGSLVAGAEFTRARPCIGNLVQGKKDGEDREIFIYYVA